MMAILTPAAVKSKYFNPLRTGMNSATYGSELTLILTLTPRFSRRRYFLSNFELQYRARCETKTADSRRTHPRPPLSVFPSILPSAGMLVLCFFFCAW